MTDLWFDRDFGRISRRGAMLSVVGPDGLRAVLQTERTFPDDLAQEEAELLGLYGAGIHGVGHLLLSDAVRLPAALRKWATAPDVPLAELGGWVPTLLSADGHACLALARDFGDHRAYATTLADRHLTVLAPASDSLIRLVSRDDLDAPPQGWDSHGGATAG